MQANSNLIPTSESVIVEEYFNYHKHVLPAPLVKGGVALDIASYNGPDDGLILQVGISTGNITNLENVPPVNVCLVIDRSGSMHGARIQKAKEATIEFVQRF